MIYLFREAWKYAGEDRWKVVLFYILHGLSFGGELLKPFAFGKAINSLQVNGVQNLSPTLRWLAVYLTGFFIFEVFHRIAQYFVVTTALRNQQRFIDAMYQRIYTLPIKWHVDHHSGEVINRVNVAGQALRDFSYSQRIYLEYIFLSIGPILFLLGISWQIGVISILLTSINLFVVQKMNNAIQPILHDKTEHFHSYAARLIDFVANIKTIISLRLKKETMGELDQRFEDYYQDCMDEFKINQPRCFIIGLGSIVTELVIILYYLWNCKRLQIPIMVGSLVMIVNYFRQMRESFFQIANSFYETLRWETSIKSVSPIIEADQDRARMNLTTSADSWSNLSIRNLQFTYEQEETGLYDLDIDLNGDSKVAIVGLSGSGKSTLVNLLAGLYHPNHVRAFFDGEETDSLKQFTDSTLLVPQDSEIFENTIRYNITFGLDIGAEELAKVIKASRLKEVLDRLPGGLETDIREKGVNISGGERQRLALARGLFFAERKRALLLDEVTSSLDSFNEKLVYQQILEGYQDRCIICTIHRLHLVEMFDKVLVMDDGQIVERGSFSELIVREGHFKRLWDKYLIGDEEDLVSTQEVI